MPAHKKGAILNDSTGNLCFEADISREHADNFRHVQYPDLGTDYIFAHPLFNDSDWFRKDDDVRCQSSGVKQISESTPQGEREGVHQFDLPTKGNASFAWAQHFILDVTANDSVRMMTPATRGLN